MNDDDLTLIPNMPDLIPDPDRRRQRENERRVEQFIRRLKAEMSAEIGAFYRRFMVME